MDGRGLALHTDSVVWILSSLETYGWRSLEHRSILRRSVL